MHKDWWVPFLQWTIWGIVMSVIAGWLARSRLQTRPATEVLSLRHPLSTLLLGLVCSLLFFGATIASNTVWKNPTTTIWTTLGFAFFGAMGLPIIADYFFARHYLSTEGIAYGRMTGRRGNLPWTEVTHVRYASVMKWFVLRARDGTTVRISALLMGLPEFARLLLHSVPTHAIDPDALPVLEETRNGRPPSVWV